MAYNLKSEEEVKEYIHNLGIEYRFGCYSEKKPEVCHLLGDYMEAIKKDFEKAAKIYRINCEDSTYAKSCLKYGNYCVTGKGGAKKDMSEAYKYFQRACAAGDKDGCYNEGVLLVNDVPGAPTDVAKGMELLEKSCMDGNDRACHHLSGMCIIGGRDPKDPEKVLVPKDMKRAFMFAQRGCDMYNMYSCANLSRMYKVGDGCERNDDLAKKYRDLAVDLQEQMNETNKTLTFQQGLKST